MTAEEKIKGVLWDMLNDVQQNTLAWSWEMHVDRATKLIHEAQQPQWYRRVDEKGEAYGPILKQGMLLA